MTKTLLTVALLALTASAFAGSEAGAGRKGSNTQISAEDKKETGHVKQTAEEVEKVPEAHSVSAVTSRSGAVQ
jgi:hypothetical protein